MTFEAQFQGWLDAFGQQGFGGDYATWRAHWALPVTVSTRNATTILQNEGELRKMFLDYLDMIARMGVTRAHRVSLGVKPVGPDKLTGTYSTQFYAGDTPVGVPFDCDVTLHRVDDIWRTKAIGIDVENRSFPITPARTEAIDTFDETSAPRSARAKEVKK